MYEEYYGLRERPFELTPNPRYLFFTAPHREALSNLQYGITGRRGITLLVGEAGTGKTTLVRAALRSDAVAGATLVYLNNPALTRAEFLECLARGFGLSAAAATSKAVLLVELSRVLAQHLEQRRPVALVVDEAQALPRDILEEIRLLANIETDTDKLLPVILAGQPELADRLNDPALRQLKQRVALRCELRPLTARETAAYISRRVRIAGGDGDGLFTAEAVARIHACSRGIPRTISVICDNALVTGFAADRRPIDHQIVDDVCRDFDLAPAAAPAPAPVQAEVRPSPEPRQAAAWAGSATSGDVLFTWVNRRRFSFFGI
jgi:general secretion pathway protein A